MRTKSTPNCQHIRTAGSRCGSPALHQRRFCFYHQAWRPGIVNLGNSSLRFLHVMSERESGREVARLGQYGVQLDLDARRPAALSPEFRERATKLVVPT